MRTESRISFAEGGGAADKRAAATMRTAMITRIALDLFNVSTNHLSLTLPNGSAAFSSYQRAMDEPGAGFVHGRAELRRRLESAAHYNPLCRAHLWRLPGTRLHLLFIDCDCYRRADHEHAEVGDQSETAKARSIGPDGAAGERPAGVCVDLQKTGGAPVRRIRSTARRCFFSVGPHDQQHHRGNLFDAVLPARLALLDFHRAHRLLANLPGGALAE